MPLQDLKVQHLQCAALVVRLRTIAHTGDPRQAAQLARPRLQTETVRALSLHFQGTVVSTREGSEHTAMLDKPENGHLDSRAGLLEPWIFSKHLRSR